MTLVKTEAVAALLDVDPKTVRALVDAGSLRAVRIGKRCLRFDPADVAAFIAQAKACPSIPKADIGTMTSSTKGGVTMARPARRRAAALKPFAAQTRVSSLTEEKMIRAARAALAGSGEK